MDIISHKLLLQGWEVIRAADGTSALKLALEKQPDIVILDILLPGMDGIEILSKLKADDATKAIPVVMFSNLDDTDKREQCKTLGAEAFYVKALVDLEMIVDEIQKILAR